MLKRRSLWFLGPILLAVVLLLAHPRGTSHVAPPAPAPSGGAVAAAGSQAVDATAGVEEREPAPRHPEIGFRSRELLVVHFRKHGGEFHAGSAEDYLRLAQSLRDRTGPGVLTFVRNDAVTCKFERETGAFIAYNSDGTIRTFFRPRDGEAYFERQKHRGAGVP
jgi:hypothetical protein